MRVGGADARGNQIPYRLVGDPQTGENYPLQRFCHRSESSGPHVRLPSPGVRHQEDEPPERLPLKASRHLSQEPHKTEENRGFTLNGRTRNLKHKQ